MTTEAFILEKPSDPAALARTPGLYVAPSSSPSYGTLLGLAALSRAQLLGETFLEDGRRAIAVEVSSARRNAPGQIVIGSDFFASALRDYGDWQEKWWREAIQNAVDAGASEIDCVVTGLDEAGRPTDNQASVRSVEVSCQDNGRGMDEDILINKFLVLGGTTKRAGDTVGGFGKAKELLLLPWLRWHMHSGDMIVEGHGIQYDVKHTGSSRKGTGITVWMPADKYTREADAISFIKKCFLPGIAFSVNGTALRASQRVGALVASLDGKIDITYKKTSKEFSSPTCLVRVKGLYMFDRYVQSDAKGVVIVEVTGPSLELLTANRDGFRDFSTRQFVDQYLNRLASDVKSATKGKRNIVQKKFKGTGKFDVQPDVVESQMMMSLGSLEPELSGKTFELTANQAQTMIEVLSAFGGSRGGSDDDEAEVGLNLRVSAATAGAMMDVPVTGPSHVEAIAKQLSWEPDFYLYNEIEDFHVPAKLTPEKMAPGVRKLARFWAEMCRFVLIQLGSAVQYGIGWHFDEDEDGNGYTAASYVKDDAGEHWLMLNPFVGGDLKRGEIYSLTDKSHVNRLYAMAVHECTHMSDGVSRHNEAFASAFTTNVARTANRAKQIEAIRKSVVARGAQTGALEDLKAPTVRASAAHVAAPIPSPDELLEHFRSLDRPPLRMDSDWQTAAGMAMDYHPETKRAAEYAEARWREFEVDAHDEGNPKLKERLNTGVREWRKAHKYLLDLARSER